MTTPEKSYPFTRGVVNSPSEYTLNLKDLDPPTHRPASIVLDFIKALGFEGAPVVAIRVNITEVELDILNKNKEGRNFLEYRAVMDESGKPRILVGSERYGGEISKTTYVVKIGKPEITGEAPEEITSDL